MPFSKGLKFIGTISTDESNQLIGDSFWEPTQFDRIPLSAIGYPSGYLFTLGSGCYSSMATTSQYGITYHAGLDIVRQDCDSGTITFDVDHYVVSPKDRFCAVFMEPPPPYHHLTKEEELIKHADPQWQTYIKHSIGKKMD